MTKLHTEVMALIHWQTGKLVAGTLRINQRNRTMGFVDIAGLDVNVFIDGDQLRNRYVL